MKYWTKIQMNMQKMMPETAGSSAGGKKPESRQKGCRRKLQRAGECTGCGGMTLVEVVVVLVILTILSAIIVPLMTGYIDRARQQKYVMEAQSVKQSLELYLLEQYADGGIDMMEFLATVSSEDLTSPDCVLADYLKVGCTKGAYIQNLTLEEGGVMVRQMIYIVDGYKIEVGKGRCSVTSLRSRSTDGK